MYQANKPVSVGSTCWPCSCDERREETRLLHRPVRPPPVSGYSGSLAFSQEVTASVVSDDAKHINFRLRELLQYNLKTVRAYLLKEAFQQLWDYNSPAWAGKFLDEWCRQTMRSRTT